MWHIPGPQKKYPWSLECEYQGEQTWYEVSRAGCGDIISYAECSHLKKLKQLQKKKTLKKCMEKTGKA